MVPRSRGTRAAAGAAISVAGIVLAAAALGAAGRADADHEPDNRALMGEARSGQVTVELGSAVGNIELTQASSPGRPIVVIDPGHGGRDPGATGVSGNSTEKNLTLALAKELRAT